VKPTAEEKDIISIRLVGEPDRLNPILTGSGYATQVMNYLFLSLQQYDPESLELTPVLIKSRPEVQPITEGMFEGGIDYTFEIVDEAMWSNGSPILASDYLFTMKAIWNSEVPSPYRTLFGFLGDIQMDEKNPKKFTVLTNKVDFYAEQTLSGVAIHPEYRYDPDSLMRNFTLKEIIANKTSDKTILKKFADQFSSPEYAHEGKLIEGAGAYRVASWDKGQQLVLERKKDWWGDALSPNNHLFEANPDQIKFKFIADNTASITALKEGQLDVLPEIDPTSFVDLQKNDFVKPKFNFFTPPYLAYAYLGLNTERTKLADKNVRRALAHLMDVDKAIATVMQGLGERVVGPIYPSKKYYHKKLELISYDVEKAVQLLTEAGWKDSDQNGILDKTLQGEKTELRIRLLYPVNNLVAKNMSLLFKENLAQAGVELELKGMEFNALVKNYKARDYDMVFGKWSILPGPDDLRQLWHTDSDSPNGFNRTGFGDAASDAIIDALQTTLDEETRNQLYISIQERIYDDQNYIFLYAPLRRIAISRKYRAETSALRPGFFVNQFERKE